MIYLHIVGGSVALIAGALALFTAKGSKLHRISGMIFVLAMLLLAVSALPLSLVAREPTSTMGALLVSYLVLTSLATVRRPISRFHWSNWASLIWAVAIAAMFLALALKGFNSPSGTIDGLPPQPMLVFATVAFLAGLGDVRMMLARKVSRAWCITRHLWRMCFALLMAAVSFFFGQAQVIPEWLRHTPLLAVPPLVIIVLMIYWLIRVRWGKAFGRARTAPKPAVESWLNEPTR